MEHLHSEHRYITSIDAFPEMAIDFYSFFWWRSRNPSSKLAWNVWTATYFQSGDSLIWNLAQLFDAFYTCTACMHTHTNNHSKFTVVWSCPAQNVNCSAKSPHWSRFGSFAPRVMCRLVVRELQYGKYDAWACGDWCKCVLSYGRLALLYMILKNLIWINRCLHAMYDTHT